VTALKQQLQNRTSDHEIMIKERETQIAKLEQTLQQNLNRNSVYLMNAKKKDTEHKEKMKLSKNVENSFFFVV
jgi:hypothetical protein